MFLQLEHVEQSFSALSSVFCTYTVTQHGATLQVQYVPVLLLSDWMHINLHAVFMLEVNISTCQMKNEAALYS